MAEANIAAINYHFGSKEHLYRAVCEHAIASMEAQYPPVGNVPDSAPLEERLRGHIESVIKRGHVDGPLRYYHRIRMTERFSPTGLADDIWEAFKATYHVQTHPKHFQLVDYEETRGSDGTRIFTGKIAVDGGEHAGVRGGSAHLQ